MVPWRCNNRRTPLRFESRPAALRETIIRTQTLQRCHQLYFMCSGADLPLVSGRATDAREESARGPVPLSTVCPSHTQSSLRNSPVQRTP